MQIQHNPNQNTNSISTQNWKINQEIIWTLKTQGGAKAIQANKNKVGGFRILDCEIHCESTVIETLP